MWTFIQTGLLISPDGVRSPAYSGSGEHKNRPEDQGLKDLGPIPCGSYTIEPAIDSPKHGPCALPLTPDPSNEMFDRDAFYIHGDSIDHPGTASQGCVIVSRMVREKIRLSGDCRLQVSANQSLQPMTIDPGIEAE